MFIEAGRIFHNMPEGRFLLKSAVVLMTATMMWSAFTLPAAASHMANPRTPEVTQIVLYPFQQCTNTVQCNARLLSGEQIIFSGILIDSTNGGVPNAKVNIYRFLSTELQPLVSTTTNADGTFEVQWQAQFFDKKLAGATFKQQITESFTVYAQFDGDDKHAPSRSGKFVFTVTTKDIFTFVETEKNVYSEKNSALVFINFVAADLREDGFSLGGFIDPDSIGASYDNHPVELSKKKTGSYVFTTPPLTSGHHQLVINAQKAGHNSHVGFVTVHVSGFYGNY